MLAQPQNTGLSLVAIELKLGPFDAANRMRPEGFIFSDSGGCVAVRSAKIKHLSCTQSSILFSKYLDVNMA